MKMLLSLFLIGIILACAWSGYKKGIIMGIGGIFVILVSLYGANLLSSTFSYEVIPALRPFVGGYMERQLTTAVYDQLGIDPLEGSDHSLSDLMRDNPDIIHRAASQSITSLGIFSSTAEAIAVSAENYAAENNVALYIALTEVMCNVATFAGGYLLAFIIILILLTVAGNIPNFSFKLPEMDMLNDVGGAVMGVVTGILFCHVITWILKFAGLLIGEEVVQGAAFASWFVKTNIVTKYIGL